MYNLCETQSPPVSPPMLPRDVREGPWQEIAADYFTHSSKDYLLIADIFSKYPFVYSTHSKTHNSLIQCLQDLFSQFGMPLHFFSDNGPPFSSEPFSSFLTSLGIEHITSSPLYPQSNGFIERQIKTIKTALTTAQPSGSSITHTLNTLCSTPIGPNLPSLHEILMNRTSYRPRHQPTHVDLDQVRDYLITQKSKQKFYYDKRHNAKLLNNLEPGQEVLFLSPIDHKPYIEGTVVNQAQEPRSYILEAQGCRYRQNRQHICPITTHIDSPFTRPCVDTTPQSHTIPTIPGPSHPATTQQMHTIPVITRPLPQTQPKCIQSKKIPHNSPPKPCLTPKSHNTTPHQCPYSRPQQFKPSNPQPKPISGPPPTAEICLNQLLAHLISLNGNPQSNLVSQNMSSQDPSPPTSPQTQSSSSSSSYTDPDSEPEATSSSICTADTESLSGQSTASTCSNRTAETQIAHMIQ